MHSAEEKMNVETVLDPITGHKAIFLSTLPEQLLSTPG